MLYCLGSVIYKRSVTPSRVLLVSAGLKVEAIYAVHAGTQTYQAVVGFVACW